MKKTVAAALGDMAEDIVSVAETEDLENNWLVARFSSLSLGGTSASHFSNGGTDSPYRRPFVRSQASARIYTTTKLSKIDIMGTNSADYWVGFDLGGTKMLAGVFDGHFSLQSRKRARTKGYEGVEQGVSRIIELIRNALVDAQVPDEMLGGIGIGCPGPLDLDEGVLINATNLGWQNVHVRDVLEKEFGCPAVVSNDVDAGVYGEYRFGSAQSARCVLGVFPGTGIGGGCIYDGKIIRGTTGSCMEIGHVQVNPSGATCGCGKRGCLETVASRLAIAAAAAQAAYRGQAPALLNEVGTNIGKIRSGSLARAVEAGDVAIEKIVKFAANQIGLVVGDVINLVAPDMVVLGGGLVEAMPELFLSSVREATNKRVIASLEGSFEVVKAKLGDDAAAIGAAAWTEQRVYEKRTAK